MAELVFFRRGEELMRVLLDRDVTVLGRGGGADVVVPHPEVSRRQAQVERRGAGFFVRDLSGRGTAVGGTLCTEAELHEGEEIGFGEFRAVFVAADGERGEWETRAQREFTERAPALPRENVALTLRVRSGGQEAVLPLEPEMTVGKAPGCSIVLPDAFASGVHCRILRRGAGVLVTDLDSTNGTWVNGLRVGSAEVGPGAWVRIGESEIGLELAREDGARAFQGILSHASCMREVFDLIERVAPSLAPVAIFGETGTGKELVARAIHEQSERSRGPFIPVNCAAISRELVESELFGHEKGAFTGATAARKGAFEEASGGTIFLDEIGELSADLQAKLLRTLELGEIKRVGSSKPFRVDTRVVCATHRDLRAMVKKGTFREDLYYRLCVIRIELPPLRSRRGDVRLLAEHFAKSHAPRGFRPQFAGDAWTRLDAHAWPGNVRELKNVIARAMLLRRGPTLTARDFVFDTGGESVVREEMGPRGGGEDDAVLLPGKTLQQIEMEVTYKALRRNGGNRRAAARELGLARSTMQKRAAELGFPPPSTGDESSDDEATP
ncbi:sigma 54-interacting transcriptional regulator [Vulgatibacter sp.]|uniref:sigma 54-interacting transcriptional regulator n=1 Tax=Vulgatibacter sp. TaxID=1971226 RepID=UPI003561D540